MIAAEWVRAVFAVAKRHGLVAPVLAAIGHAKELGFWVEVVTLVVPGLNDDERQLRALGRTLQWHRCVDAMASERVRAALQADAAVSGAGVLLMNLAGMAYNLGLKYVYVGNLADRLGGGGHTRCPHCLEVVVWRHDYRTERVQLDAAGTCGGCGELVAGRWASARGAEHMVPRPRDGARR